MTLLHSGVGRRPLVFFASPGPFLVSGVVMSVDVSVLVKNYEDLFGAPKDEAVLRAQLARAYRVVAAEASRAGRPVDGLDRELVADVVADMARYALSTAAGPVGATSTTSTAGPFSQTMQLAAPAGSMRLTAAHRRYLGVPLQRVFEARLLEG